MRLLSTICILLACSIATHAQSRKDLIGCWNMPGLKEQYLSLDSEGNFFFNEYLEYRRAFEPVFGTWKLRAGVLVLTYDEEKQMHFKVKWTESGILMLVKSGQVRLFRAKQEDCDPQ